MVADYDKIREDNIKKYGTSTHHLNLLSNLYSDRTHFIFELIQNAEDAGASKIHFNLFTDRLQVIHDGREFDEMDVKGVSGFGEGTKSEDLNQIGKFGIGFNSVYAYTTTPEVHSGEESFKIEEFVRPKAVIKPVGLKSTLLIFPFDRKDILKNQAFQEIGDRLRKLNFRTLLFLKNISTINFQINNNTKGCYKRTEKTFKSRRKVSIYNDSNDCGEDWLVFKRPIPNKDSLFVEVAFRLSTDENGKECIERDNNTPLVVFFPTEKETKLGFLIQGPYRTTPARDNIPEDNEWNKSLIAETAKLVKSVLPKIKDLGLLTIPFLNSLPINPEDFPESGMFFPLYKEVKEAFQESVLILCEDGSFANKTNAILARGSDLIELINNSQLKELFNTKENLKWVIGEITESKTPVLRSYLINEIGLKEIRSVGIANQIHKQFLENQTDEWFIKFYKFLSRNESLWDFRLSPWGYRQRTPGVLRTKPIIRLENGYQETPFLDNGKSPKVFLPPAGETKYPIVNRKIVENEEAKLFLEKQLGLSEPDLFDDVIYQILPKYSNHYEIQISDTEHQNDIRTIIDALGSISDEKKEKIYSEGKKYPFLKAINNHTREEGFKKPDVIYKKTSDLKHYFSDTSDVWFLHEDYEELGCEIWCKFGVNNLPRIIPIPNEFDGKREKFTSYEEIENRELEGLKEYLIFITQQNQDDLGGYAYILWDLLRKHLEKDKDCFYGTYKWFYRTHREKKFDSLLLDELRKYKWVPTKSDKISRPCEVEESELFEGFETSSRLIEILGIKQSKSNELEKYGISLDDVLNLIKENPQKFKEQINSRKLINKEPQFPERKVNNLIRKEEKYQEEIESASIRKYIPKENTPRRKDDISRKVKPKLRDYYTNCDEQLICQICEKEMPFKKRNGKHYFEIREILSRDFLSLELEAQYLALCPVCAAKYTEYVINGGDSKMTILKEEILKASHDNPVPIELDDPVSIRFVETHLLELQQILKSQKNKKFEKHQKAQS